MGQNNPEHFQEIQAKAHGSPKRSKMEAWLEPLLAQAGFVRNTRLLISPSLDPILALVADGSWTGIRCFGNLYEQLSWDGNKVTISK